MSEPLPILIADDDADILALVSYRLRRAGYDVVTAADGEQALTLAQERKPALAVLDVMMPGLNGFQVAERLAGDIPVILLTARVQEADVARGFAAGAVDYIRKPFSPQELLVRVQRTIGAAR